MERKDHIFTRGDMYRLVPSFFKQVKPGDRTAVHIRGSLESDVVAALRTPCVITSYAFYVPHRLVMSNFPDFIADADTAITLPTVVGGTSPFVELGETGAFNIVTLARRAYKLVYNEFFGDDAYGTHAWYTDPTADAAQNSLLPLKVVNQMLGAMALDVDEPADNYAIASTPHNIELTEFRRRLKVNARQNNQRIGGEKYFDALRRYGVEMREELTGRPQLLKRTSEVVYPQEVFNTSDTGTGTRVGRYRVSLNFDTRKFFSMEHGYVFVCHAVRPFLARTIVPLERTVGARHYYMEEMEKPFREIASLNIGTATDVEPDPLIPADQIFDLGDMQSINTPTGILTFASNAAVANLVYPSVNTSPKFEVALSVSTEITR